MIATSIPPDPRRALLAFFEAGRFAEALQCYRGYNLSARGAPEIDLVGATAAARIGEFDAAWHLAASALGGFAAREDEPGRLRTVNLLGGLAFERGKLAEAERYFREAACLAARLEDRLAAARAWNNLGSLDHQRDRIDSTLEFYEKALTAYERLGDVRGAAQTHHNLALVLREAGRLDEADFHVTRALRLAELSQDPPLLALVLMGRAELFVARHDLQAAARDIGAARILADQASDRCGVAEGLRLQALVSLRLGLLDTARDHAELGRALAREVGARLLEAECHALSGMALRGLGCREAGTTRFRHAVAALEREEATRALRRVRREWEHAPAG